MRVSQKPLTQLQMKDILLGVVDGSIKTADDIKENNERYFYNYTWLDVFDHNYMPELIEYEIPNEVKDFNGYSETNIYIPNIEKWENKYSKYSFPDDFNNVPKGTFNNEFTISGKQLKGSGNIRINMPEKESKGYIIKLKLEKEHKDTQDNTVLKIGTHKEYGYKSINGNDINTIQINIFYNDFLRILSKSEILLYEIEFIPTNDIDYKGKIEYDDIPSAGGFSEGFYAMEHNDSGILLWSGGKNEIKLLPPSNINEDLHLELVMKPFHIREDKPQRVTFSMKGNVIGDFTVHSGSPRLYDIVIPKELLTQGEIIALNMELAYTDSPHKLTGSSDKRELGMMIYSPERAEKEMSNSFTAVSGWYDNEGSHIWGGKETELMLPVNKNNPVSLYEINGGVFLNKEREPQAIDFMIEDDIISSFTAYDEDNRNYRIFVPEKYSTGKNFITLKIQTSYETAPNSFTDTDDNRLLAFKINSVKHETVSSSDLERLFGKKRVSIKDIPDGSFLNGWYDKEKEHIWADKSATLLIPVKPETKQAAISLEIAPYIDRNANPQTISFFTGDRLLGEYTASDTKYKTYDINIPEDIYNDGMLPLTIKTTYSAIPREQEKNNDDGRRLAIRLKSVKINER